MDVLLILEALNPFGAKAEKGLSRENQGPKKKFKIGGGEIGSYLKSSTLHHIRGNKMNKYIKIVLFGFLAWLIPFIASIFFFAPGGGLLVDVFLFKSIMIVVGSIVGALLLVLYFSKISKEFLREGIVVGVAWFAINIILDLIVLLPLLQIDVGNYSAQIGIRYLVIPVMSIAMGYAIAQNLKK